MELTVKTSQPVGHSKNSKDKCFKISTIRSSGTRLAPTRRFHLARPATPARASRLTCLTRVAREAPVLDSVLRTGAIMTITSPQLLCATWDPSRSSQYS
jgi:hypothetical protein